MNAFQAAELSSLMTHFSAEIERVRFYSDLSDLMDGECHFLANISEKNDKIILEFSYYIGTYYPERLTSDDRYDDDLMVASDKKTTTLYIPDAPNGITEYKNRYSRDYAVESITDIMDKALHCLERIEAAQDAFNRRTSPYYEPNSMFA